MRHAALTAAFTSTGPRLRRVGAREGEELAHEPGRALGRAQDLAHLLVDARVWRRPPDEREQRVAGDHGQQVVEVVRDAAGELADRVELLRLAQLLLQPVRRGDVLDHAQDVRRGSLLVELDRRVEAAPRSPTGSRAAGGLSIVNSPPST